MILRKWKPYEIVWLFCFLIIISILTFFLKDTLFGLSVLLTGVICVVLAAKGNNLTYIFGMYNTFGYAFIAYQNNLFGEVILNLCFFVPMNIIGYLMWKKHIKEDEVEMLYLEVKKVIFVIVSSVLLIILCGYFLSLIKGQNTPFIDATTNILSIVATILMVRRYREMWIVYIILNIFTVFMWSVRFFSGSSDALIMIVMWTLYLINSIYGYINWSNGSKKTFKEMR